MRHKYDNGIQCMSFKQNTNLSLFEGVAWHSGLHVRNVEVVGLSPIKGIHCFLEQETLPLLLSTGWFEERIRA